MVPTRSGTVRGTRSRDLQEVRFRIDSSTRQRHDSLLRTFLTFEFCNRNFSHARLRTQMYGVW